MAASGRGRDSTDKGRRRGAWRGQNPELKEWKGYVMQGLAVALSYFDFVETV